MENLTRKLIKNLGRKYYRAEQKKAKRTYIAASGKVLGEAELDNMLDATLDMWLTTGRFNEQFEKEFAAFLGVKHALSVNSHDGSTNNTKRACPRFC